MGDVGSGDGGGRGLFGVEEGGRWGWGVALDSEAGEGEGGLDGGVGNTPMMSRGQSPGGSGAGGVGSPGMKGEGEGEVLNVIINSDEQKLQAHLQVRSRVKSSMEIQREWILTFTQLPCRC